MDLYYFGTFDEHPESRSDWDVWHMIIPLDGKRPGIGDTVITFRFPTVSYRKVDVQDDIKKWPHPFAEDLKRAATRAIFRVGVK